jgi:hypothetical protein
MLNWVAGTEQGARDLLERRQRRVALERLRERRGARVADQIVPQAAARRGGSGMLVARHEGTEQGAGVLPELCQRRVALERLRERRGSRDADLVVLQAVARRGGSGMLVASLGRRRRAGRAQLTTASSASRCS